ncbi:phosphoglycerate dehydrogenase-like enzyme [Bacillus pakistanensis]|uniref:Phosphoglycerate dehydrogenase-like enzyme n=1 Tax=Rossellomorea pakistanensis TaxID=992288 RepID=A0ABS2NGS6_9BACI|nr:D-2-hydroxyacid dehydrogenase [Bacillus pakistanensis]MBM7587072.1 phosphoglycerate dehydrogenase-like enzyme [Bacillus pakistanensis]
MKILFTFDPEKELRNQLIKTFPQCEYDFVKTINDAGQLLSQAEVIVTMGEDLEDHHIEEATSLRWIMVTSAGMEMMPFEKIKEKGILVTNARGIHKIPMAEFTIGLMLQHAKQFIPLNEQEHEEIWSRRLPTSELCDQTILILGTGAIGQEIARLAQAFRMVTIGVNTSGTPVKYFDRIETIANLESLLPEIDFFVSVLPSTNKTRYILKKKHFEMMKASSVFINLGRGDVIRESVLLKVMEDQDITHAFLDVFIDEPLKEGHPFWKMKNITVTPHISSTTKMYVPRAFDILKHNLRTYIHNKGDYINIVDVERGY